MTELKQRIHDDENGLDYILVGDYYIPALTVPDEKRPVGMWGRMHREYLREYHHGIFADLTLSGKLWTYLADLNEQAQDRYLRIIEQMKEKQHVDNELRDRDMLAWIGAMENIQNCAREIIMHELIYTYD